MGECLSFPNSRFILFSFLLAMKILQTMLVGFFSEHILIWKSLLHTMHEENTRGFCIHPTCVYIPYPATKVFFFSPTLESSLDVCPQAPHVVSVFMCEHKLFSSHSDVLFSFPDAH